MERKKGLSLLPKVVASLISLLFLLAYFSFDSERWVRALLIIAFFLCSGSIPLIDLYRGWKTERTRSNKWKLIAYFVYVAFLCACVVYSILTRPVV